MKTHQSPRFAPALPWILFLAAMVFFVMLPRLLLSPMLLRISEDLGIGFERASLFFLTSSVGYVLGLLTSGYVARLLAHKWTITLSVALACISLMVLSRANSVLAFHLILFFGNWSVGLYPGSGIAAVSSLAPESHSGLSLAIHECGPNFTFILAPVIAAALVPSLGWRGVMLLTGACGTAFAMSFAVWGRAGKDRGEAPNFRNIVELARNRSFWIISILFILAATAALGVYTILPTYLILEHGLPERFVNNLVGASRITGFLAILSAGSLADRFGFRPVVAVILAVTGLATILMGLSRGTLLLVSVFLQPMIIQAYFPVALNALARVTAPERRNLAVSLAIPMANLVSVGVAPALLSAAGARGLFPQSFVVLGVLVVAGLALLPLMRKE